MRYLLIAALLLTACAGPEEEEPGQSAQCAYQPCFRGGEVRGEKNFAFLINNFREGKPEPTPWAGYWFPYTSNGIAGGRGGSSPAGKYDAVRGRKTNAQGWEVGNHGSGVRGVQGWWGHCNGWCAAAALFPEPSVPSKVNGITFDVADIKALLSEAGMEAGSDFFGTRVEFGVGTQSPIYQDVVPGQVFLILMNYVGRLKHPVLIDRYTLDQVWNQPLVGYRFEAPKPSDYLGADPSAPGVYRMNVTFTIWWAEDGVPADVQTPQFTFDDRVTGTYPDGRDTGIRVFTPRTLKAELWLDGPVEFDSSGKLVKSGNVVVTRQEGTEYFVGGAWRMGEGFYSSEGWPDYMWVPYSILKPTDYGNPHVHIDWLKKHIVPAGGVDDPSTPPAPIEPPPSPRPTTSASPIPWPFPTPGPTMTPTPTPTFPPPGPGPSVRPLQ
jgi:hypothetical protein